MSGLIEIAEFDQRQWSEGTDIPARSRHWCERLEAGKILFFPATPFTFDAADREFLCTAQQSSLKVHKNISYRPANALLRGVSADDPAYRDRMAQIMGDYSQNATGFLKAFLTPYAQGHQLDYASFRPIEEANRPNSLHKRNDLLHVDAFPSRPTQGGRILRIFTNVNPLEERHWRGTVPFPQIVHSMGEFAGLREQAASLNAGWRVGMREVASTMKRSLPLPITVRSSYDSLMLRLHDRMKENGRFQETCEKFDYRFPPGSTWMCYTDGVAHAVMSGKYAIEQTYIIPLQSLVSPKDSPIRVLEEWCGRSLGK